MMNYSGCPNQQAIVRRSHPAQPGETFDWSANLIAKRFRAPEGGYIPNPYGRDLGLGYRVRTLPQGRDRWGKKLLLCQRRNRAIRKCIPSNHPITYQRYEKGNRHTLCSIRNIPHDNWSNRSTHNRHDE